MTRKRFQKGHIHLRGKRDPYWEGFFREDVLLPDGRILRRQRTKNLGRLADVPTKRLAERRLAAVIAELNDPDYRPRPVSTVRDFVEQKYLRLSMPVKKRTTQHSYNVVLSKHVLPDLGDRQLTEVTEEDVQGLVNRKAASGLAWNTVKNIRWVLSAVFTAAVKYGYRKSNPAWSVSLPPEPVWALSPLPSDEELNRLEEALDEPYRTMVWLALTTGLRVSELLALRWRAVDWEGRRLWVVEAVHDGHFHSPKTHRSRRPVVLDDRDVDRLAEFRRRTPDAKEEDWLFPNKCGTAPLRADNVLEKVIRPAVKKLGVTRVTWHLLRHWHTTALSEVGVPIKAVQERLGHSRAETTMKHYLHISEQVHREAARAISRRLRTTRKTSTLSESVSGFVSELPRVSA